MKDTKISGIRQQAGQAATEFVIAAAFILVPLFLIVPLIGKYIDIKHATIQHARYTAWEYTVWSGPDSQIMDNIDANQSAGEKSYKQAHEEGLQYFFTDRTSTTYGTGSVAMAVDPLWKDHRATPLFSLVDIKTDLDHQSAPVSFGKVGEVTRDLVLYFGKVISHFGDLLKKLGVDAKFDVLTPNNAKGYFHSDVAVSVRSLDHILPPFDLHGNHAGDSPNFLTVTASAAVQSNAWNAGSRKNATAESRGLVVTALLSPVSTPLNKIVNKINDLTSKIPLLNVKVPGMPEFGYIQDDLLPYEHLEGNRKKLVPKKEGILYKPVSPLYHYE